MKHILVLIAGLMSAQFALTEDQPSVPPRFFKVPANTPIRVRTKHEISSETAHVGDDVQMEVLGDVIVNGYVVIRQGASAIGQISRVKEARSMGRRGNVALTLNYVEAVTGEHVPAGGSRTEKAKGRAGEMASEVGVATAVLGAPVAALWLFEKGDESTIPPGTAFSVYTVEDTMLDLSMLPPAGLQAVPLPIGANGLPRATSTSSTTVPSLGVVVSTRVNVGAEITGVVRDSVAERAGLQVGDVINAIDRKPVRTAMELAAELLNRAPASQVRLGYVVRSATAIPSDARSSGALNYYPKETVVILAGNH
jgi:membrane-associated protease RseP (regulator of RpoE activity)